MKGENVQRRDERCESLMGSEGSEKLTINHFSTSQKAITVQRT